MSQSDSPTYLAALGDSTKIHTWSGIPFHLLAEAKTSGMLQNGLSFEPGGLQVAFRRCAWNWVQAFLRRGVGGYQYSNGFLESLWRPFHAQLRGSRVVNCFQLYPESVVSNKDCAKWFYIDMTLKQLFASYGFRGSDSTKQVDRILSRESFGYLAAKGIIAHSRWAAQSLSEDYAIPLDRIHIVVPGANIEREAYRAWYQEAKPLPEYKTGDVLRLIFVGKDWARKGLKELISALQILRAEGVQVLLRVVGCSKRDVPTEITDVPGVEWLGEIDKKTQLKKFLEVVSSNHIGCLPSKAEAGGIALREYHALGLVTVAPRLMGVPDHVVPEASMLLDPPTTPATIASGIFALISSPQRFATFRHNAWAARQSALWSTSVEKMSGLW